LVSSVRSWLPLSDINIIVPSLMWIVNMPWGAFEDTSFEARFVHQILNVTVPVQLFSYFWKNDHPLPPVKRFKSISFFLASHLNI
jgi:hypothetical protein